MPTCLIDKIDAPDRPIHRLHVIKKTEFPHWQKTLPPFQKQWVTALGTQPHAGTHILLPNEQGEIASLVLFTQDTPSLWDFASLPSALPKGLYAFEEQDLDHCLADQAALGWALGSYRFTAYKRREGVSQKIEQKTLLLWPEKANRHRVEATASGIFLARNLINIPAADMGPADLEKVASLMGEEHGADVKVIQGDDLLATGYPMIHAVGKGSPRAPRLIDMRWGDKTHPKVTLVGKGVCFDSGGLDLKPASAMKLMKKDMGGAAITLGLAKAIMMTGLPIALRVLVPAVENSVSGRAFRPLDILESRKGLTVEVGNTDAEGRLILADALFEAVQEAPEIVIDLATLTGAARIALGTELPALFCNDEGLATDILEAGLAVEDPLWRLPLHQAYKRQLDSKAADLSNISEGAFGGAITAALFLEHFIDPTPVLPKDEPRSGDDSTSEAAPSTAEDADKTPAPPCAWAHIDVMAWMMSSKPGRPEGGDAMALRALFSMLEKRFGNPIES